MDRQKAAGYDFFKIYDHLSLDAFDAIAQHSRETGFSFAGHVPQAVPIEHAMRAGMLTIEHLTGWFAATTVPGSPLAKAIEPSDQVGRLIPVAEQLERGQIGWGDVIDPSRRRAIAALAAETGVWNVPTLVVLERLSTSRRQAQSHLSEPLMSYVSPKLRSEWDPAKDSSLKDFTDDQLEADHKLFEERLAEVKALHDVGARLLAGSDTPNPWVVPGFSLHEELTWLIKAGLTPYEALVTATRAPAEFLRDESFGTIVVGKRAELVLLDANPLEDINATRSIVGVVTQARWLRRAELDAMLESVAESNRL